MPKNHQAELIQYYEEQLEDIYDNLDIALYVMAKLNVKPLGVLEKQKFTNIMVLITDIMKKITKEVKK